MITNLMRKAEIEEWGDICLVIQSLVGCGSDAWYVIVTSASPFRIVRRGLPLQKRLTGSISIVDVSRGAEALHPLSNEVPKTRHWPF